MVLCVPLRAAAPFGSAQHDKTKFKSGGIESVIERLRASTGTRAMASLGLCVLLLLVAPGRLAAQDNATRPSPVFADVACPSTSEAASSRRSFPVYRLLPKESPISPGVTAPDSWIQWCSAHPR